MRGFLLILLCSIYAPFECYGSNRMLRSFFVARQDTDEAICIWPKEAQHGFEPAPTFDLDKLQFPADVGLIHLDWLNDWQLENDTKLRHNEGGHLSLIAANSSFHYFNRINQDQSFIRFGILASNITLWVADEKQPRGAGMLFELDHLNPTTNHTETIVKYCDQIPEDEAANCTILAFKNEKKVLSDAHRWINLWMKIYYSDRITGAELFESRYDEEKSIIKWNLNNITIPNPYASYMFYSVFAKSHQSNAAVSSIYNNRPDRLENNKEMKRKYTKRSSGKLCIRVTWNTRGSKEIIYGEFLEVKNLASGREQSPSTAEFTEDLGYYLYQSFFQWDHLDAGEYEITLRFDQRKPKDIDLCQDLGSTIKKTWVSMPKAIKKCQFDRYDSLSMYTWYFATPIQPNWTSAEWEHVCDRLGIGSKDPEVPIRFCNSYGCNFSKCPHLLE